MSFTLQRLFPRARFTAAAALLAMSFSLPAHAASISYHLDQSNEAAALPNGTPYLVVTIADGAAGAVDFTVSVLPSLATFAVSNFGIQSFGFNVAGAAEAMGVGNITGLPTGWNASVNKTQNGFGRFDFVVGDAPGGGQVRLSPTVSFSITGIDGDSIFDYVSLFTGGKEQGQVYFAAHVAGMRVGSSRPVESAYFAGNRLAGQVVPVPAAAWLMGSALVLLGSLRRRVA